MFFFNHPYVLTYVGLPFFKKNAGIIFYTLIGKYEELDELEEFMYFLIISILIVLNVC